MMEHHVGPILFHEQCFYKKELKFGDQVEVNLRLTKMSADSRKWSMEHEIWKNGNVLAATITIDAAWMDTEKRKLTVPPPIINEIFSIVPKSEHFVVI